MIKFNHFKIHPIIGIGYWKDTYTPKIHGLMGEAHNLILPFFRIQWGFIKKEESTIQSKDK